MNDLSVELHKFFYLNISTYCAFIMRAKHGRRFFNILVFNILFDIHSHTHYIYKRQSIRVIK